ncbi:translocation and assembly module lipoprotein TamL [Brumimicrobium aurantiacum]|uniref:Bacterial surface antigen (D15) domain-containing protein n=1 Tax=Brumimicrobium aurantiacum TaxID=1737063 RepID=A0A3E1EWG9_9FLAO|nr:BamA/TamA family outer membrane protein [Brumimicrobium aurantiacum]RFC53899.1 hypothetical protein DXU93_10145 [Brumimicrobium aurantiacum]
MQTNSKTYYIIFALIALLLSGCSVKKFIPEGEYLYRGGTVSVKDTVELENTSGLEGELQSLLYPEPNTRVLGMYPKLYFHYKAQKEDPNFIVRFLNRKIGEEPAYFSDVRIENTTELIENRLENSGFFYSTISSNIKKDSNKRTAITDFSATVGRPYRLVNYSIIVDSLKDSRNYPIYEELENALSETILKDSSRYDLSAFKAERDRIDQYLKNKGYYNFNSNFILFQADTNLNQNKTYNLYLKLKEGVPQKSKVPYTIKKVEVYPNAAAGTSKPGIDTVTIEEVKFIQGHIFFKPEKLHSFILINPDERYDPVKSRYTSQRISSIGTYKFVNIDYNEVKPTTKDSLWHRELNAKISLSPLNKRSLRAELQGVTKSNNFTGPNLGLTYINRNVFRGGENFSITGSFGYEKQLGRDTDNSSSLQTGLKTSLSFPRLIFPGDLDKYFRYSIPKTKVSLGFDYFSRSNLYTLNSYSASFGYVWNANKYVTHQLNPFQIDYVRLGNTSEQFESILDDNPFLRRSFEQQFIAGLTYSFTYNELNVSQKKGKINFKMNFDLAGNTVNLIGKMQDDGIKTFMGLKYAQYVKGDVDFSYHYDIDRKGNTIIGRVFGGIGVPYGNSTALPFVKQYFSGGSYSVRAFQIRSLGPGSYQPENDENGYFDQAGDIRLEANLEYRFPLISVLKGAVFVDAGNVWLKNENEALPGGKFTSDFMNKIGIGPGVGLRVDVQGFVIRFDFAAPIKRPYADWEFEYDAPVFNFAIGYPF